MREKIMDIAIIIMTIIIIIVSIIVIKIEFFPQKKPQEEKQSSPNLYYYSSPETGACYYITDAGFICPIYNPDGTIYTISVNQN